MAFGSFVVLEVVKVLSLPGTIVSDLSVVISLLPVQRDLARCGGIELSSVNNALHANPRHLISIAYRHMISGESSPSSSDVISEGSKLC
jgi:hypothetical protein